MSKRSADEMLSQEEREQRDFILSKKGFSEKQMEDIAEAAHENQSRGMVC